MFTNTYLPHVGGVARSVRFFAEDLIDLGHRVLVVAPTFSDDKETSGKQPEVLRVPAIQQFNGSDFSVRIPLPLYVDQEIEQFVPDVVHSHHPFLLGDAAVRVARKRTLPLVFTHHTLYEQYTHYVPIDSDKLKNFVIRLATMYANLCSRVVAPSRSIARLLLDRGVSRPIEEIPTGVNVSSFAAGNGKRFRRDSHLPEGAPVIGHVGRLAPEKNLSYLAEAVSIFLEKAPKAHFLVIGDGPSQAEIKQIFADRHLEDRLHLTGEASGNRLRDAYGAMDLFVFSSKSETQGMVLVEAMAAGKPVIALDASGSREVIRDGENGRLLPGDASTENFAEAIREFHSKPELARDWSSGARQTAQRFSREACAAKMEKLYRSLLNRHADSVPEVTAEIDPLEALSARIKTEWELWSLKTAAAADAIQSISK
ncbi:MAG: glycosyltransferase [Desulfobacterales bacterium]